MEKENSHMSKRILNLTLEIIYLLTGEECIIVKKPSNDHMTHVSQSWSRKQNPMMKPLTFPSNDKKILEVTQKIIKLLEGEVPIRCQEVTVSFGIEEGINLGHKDLYKDDIMENRPPLTSPDPIDIRETQRDLKAEEEAGHARIKEEEVPPEISTERQHIRNNMGDIPLKYIKEENLITPNLRPVLPSADLSSDSSTHGGGSLNHSITHHTDHRTGGKFPCYMCGKCFTRTETLTVHHRSYTGEKPCSVCGKCFLRKLCFINQERSHTEEKPFSCSECGKCFNQKSNLTLHQRIHTGEKPYSCSQCGKSFHINARFLQHQRTHTGVKPYSCSECGKCFTESSTLAKHKRTHTGEKPYSCSECGKCFSQRCNLELHKRIHTGQKPYSCSECAKCFTTSSAFVNHKRTHTGEKPYSCSECGKCFTGKNNLLLHQRVHSGQKP